MFRNPRLLLLAFALIAGAVLVALLAFTMGRPPVRPPLPNPNGYDDLVKACEAVLGDISDWPVLDHDSLLDLVSTNAEPLRLLRLGLTCQCVMPMDSALTNATGMMNQLVQMKRLVHLLAAEGRLREMENQPADAARSYVEAIRFGNEMSQGGFIITRLVGLACLKIVVYTDESGTHDKSGTERGSEVAVVAGYAAKVDSCAKFCRDWRALLKEYSAPYFQPTTPVIVISGVMNDATASGPDGSAHSTAYPSPLHLANQ